MLYRDIKKILMGIIFLCFVLFFKNPVFAQNGQTTIRVGYPIQESLTMIDEEGNYSGYLYDYLMEISQYTGWNYEFVQLEGGGDEQLLGLMDMLKNGEIDILGGVYYNDSMTDSYSYSGYSCGTNYTGIFVPDDSPITESSVYDNKDMKIGVYSRKLLPNKNLEQFSQMNGLNIEQVVVDDLDALQKLIKEGLVNGILSTDLTVKEHDGMRSVAHFSPIPFYFITTKGNVEVVRQLDYAISTIQRVNPTFPMQLYNNYFSSPQKLFTLTDEEQNFIDSAPSLTVAVYDNKPPFQFQDKKTSELSGITIEMLENFSQKTGLKFEYKTASTYEEYISLISSNQVDIAGDALLNYRDAVNTNNTYTLSWYSLPVYLIFKEGLVIDENTSYAIPYSLKNAIDLPKNATFFDTVEECMQAVQNEKTDASLVDEFCSQYFLNSGVYSHLKFLNQPDSMTQKLCFGITGPNKAHLLSIFNKYISSISEFNTAEIIYRNTYQHQVLPWLVQIKLNFHKILIVIALFFAVFFALYTYYRGIEQKKLAFENKRYNALNSLANEFFYEYNMQTDQLILPEKCADYFSCDSKINNFSERVCEIPEAERRGIWQLGSYILQNEESGLEVSCLMENNTRNWFKIISCHISNQKKQMHIIGKIVNIQDSKAEQIRLEQKASRDGLTGLYNMATIRGLINESLADLDSYVPCFLIILDIDYFKDINDRFGHYNGDRVLTEVSTSISNIFFPCLAGRLGGDEFIIFTEKTTADEIAVKCQALLDQVSLKTLDMLGSSTTLSIGITPISKGKAFDDIYKEADQALYQVKSASRNGFAFYTIS